MKVSWGRKKRINSQRWLLIKRDEAFRSGTRLTKIAMVKRGDRMGKGRSNVSLTSYSLPSKNDSQRRFTASDVQLSLWICRL